MASEISYDGTWWVDQLTESHWKVMEPLLLGHNGKNTDSWQQLCKYTSSGHSTKQPKRTKSAPRCWKWSKSVVWAFGELFHTWKDSGTSWKRWRIKDIPTNMNRPDEGTCRIQINYDQNPDPLLVLFLRARCRCAVVAAAVVSRSH